MKQVAIITPVPEIVNSYLENSILRKAVEQEVVTFQVVNLRDFGIGGYRQVDDTPYGGGSGMVMMPEPLFKALDQTIARLGGEKDDLRILYPTPQGQMWSHETALDTSRAEALIVICGHYKGVDERVIQKYVTHEYSLGDYVVSGGELPALIMVDSIVRLIPGVLNSYESALTDSHASDLLDGPHYTKPREIDGMSIPDILVSGHHKHIEAWRREKRERRTELRRPDIWKEYLKKHETVEK